MFDEIVQYEKLKENLNLSVFQPKIDYVHSFMWKDSQWFYRHSTKIVIIVTPIL